MPSLGGSAAESWLRRIVWAVVFTVCRLPQDCLIWPPHVTHIWAPSQHSGLRVVRFLRVFSYVYSDMQTAEVWEISYIAANISSESKVEAARLHGG